MSLDVTLLEREYTQEDEDDRFYRPLFTQNITHNLSKMARECGLHQPLWEPHENGFTTAQEIIPLIQEGLRRLRTSPEHYKQFDPPNKWGDYQALVEFTENYLQACQQFPHARIHISK